MLNQLAKSVCQVGVFNVGRIAYSKGLELQQSFADALKANTCPWNGGVLLLLEHSPVYTVGIRTKSYTAEDKAWLVSLGAEFHETNRGGLITFHGPGQLVAYPVINLKLWTPSVKWYIATLEDAVIDLCAKYDVAAHRYHPYPGIWVGEEKLCAVGVHASRFVTTHGIAINCNTDMNWFEHIVPCGIEGKGVTSLSQLLAKDIAVDDVIPKFLDSFKKKFPCELISPP